MVNLRRVHQEKMQEVDDSIKGALARNDAVTEQMQKLGARLKKIEADFRDLDSLSSLKPRNDTVGKAGRTFLGRLPPKVPSSKNPNQKDLLEVFWEFYSKFHLGLIINSG